VFILKYDNLIQDCSFEEMPEKYELMDAGKYSEANINLKIPLTVSPYKSH
jgi:hypothetical protein